MSYYNDSDAEQTVIFVVIGVIAAIIVIAGLVSCCRQGGKASRARNNTQSPIPPIPIAQLEAGGVNGNGAGNRTYPVTGMFNSNARVGSIELGDMGSSSSNPTMSSGYVDTFTADKGAPALGELPPSYNAPYHKPPEYQ